jgi:hypothetical protein
LPLELAILGLAEPLEGSGLEDPEELHLDPELDVADLVEEHGSEGGAAFEPPAAVRGLLP